MPRNKKQDEEMQRRYERIVAMLDAKELPVAEIARIAGVSTKTVQRARNALVKKA